MQKRLRNHSPPLYIGFYVNYHNHHLVAFENNNLEIIISSIILIFLYLAIK